MLGQAPWGAFRRRRKLFSRSEPGGGSTTGSATALEIGLSAAQVKANSIPARSAERASAGSGSLEKSTSKSRTADVVPG